MRLRRALFVLARRRRLRALLLAIVAVGSTGIALAAYGTTLLRSLEGSTVNTRFTIHGDQKPKGNLVIVKIEDKTFNDLNKQWPFPRAYFGKVIGRIARDRPAAIATDVQFTEPSSIPDGENDDLALLDAIQNAHGKTVFSVTEADTSGNGNFKFLGSTKGRKLLSEVGSRAANGLLPFDPGGAIRRMGYSIDGIDTLAIKTAEVATGHKLPRSRFPGATAWIDFDGASGEIPSVSFSTVYLGHTRPGFFKGKIVVIGATAPTLFDIHPTSTDSAMPGPEIQANAIDTVLRGMPLTSLAGWANILLIVLLGMIVPVVSLRLGPIAATNMAFAVGGVYLVAAQLAFNGGKVVSVVYPIGALILAGAGSLAVQLITEAFERVRVRDLFSRFVPENVVDEVLASADGLRLGGVQREGTVMFCDLRGFTSLAETLTPARVIEILNHYLSEMSDAILDSGGTLVAYMGDGIMAVFGAPLAQVDHADRALSAAREMLGVRLPRFNEWLRSEQLSEGFRMGIGLNSGSVMSGHVGSERRVEYTAVGDTTNSAARIEAMTKGTPHQLLFSDATRELLKTQPDALVFVTETDIRGRVGRVKLWSLSDGDAASAEMALTGTSTPEAGTGAATS